MTGVGQAIETKLRLDETIRVRLGETLMVNNCANPKCAKPLHYLREGRIFVFDVMDGRIAAGPDGKMKRRLEHYWLCGICSQTMALVQSGDVGIRIVPKQNVQGRAGVTITASAMAS